MIPTRNAKYYVQVLRRVQKLRDKMVAAGFPEVGPSPADVAREQALIEYFESVIPGAAPKNKRAARS